MASSRFSNVDEYGFERPIDFDKNAYEDFMSTYLKVLARRSKKWTDLLKKKRYIKNRSKFRRYIRKGIPSEHRAKIWMICSGAEEAKKSLGYDLYKKMLSLSPDPLLAETIKTDLPRTFPENIFFSGGDDYQQQLYRVLLAYGMHNKRIGYCQGMNYVAGMLLLVTKSEDTSFWLMKMLIENILPDYYSPNMSGLVVDIDVVSDLIREKYSDVHTHFNNLGLPWPVVITKWFICLYCDVLPIETVLRVWDCLFNEGCVILFQVALALVAKHRESFLDCDQFTDLAEYLKVCTRDSYSLNCHTFMQNVFSSANRVSEKKLNYLRNVFAKKKQ